MSWEDFRSLSDCITQTSDTRPPTYVDVSNDIDTRPIEPNEAKGKEDTHRQAGAIIRPRKLGNHG